MYGIKQDNMKVPTYAQLIGELNVSRQLMLKLTSKVLSVDYNVMYIRFRLYEDDFDVIMTI